MIRIDLDASEAPYEQIRTQLAQQINSGELAVGARLPTVRSLAADLGVASNTVGRAYAELEHAGLIETGRRNGSRVSANGDESRARAAAGAAEFAQLARRLGLSETEAVRFVRAALSK